MNTSIVQQKISSNESDKAILFRATGQDTVSVAGQSSTGKPLADGIASQSNPRFPVEALSN